MSKDMSILRALRERTTISLEIATAHERALKNAVSVEDSSPSDFNPEEQIKLYSERQAELRSLKVAITKASLKNTVKIPEGLNIPESGQEVPAYHAILIRDDLKSKKKFLVTLSSVSLSNDRDYYMSDREPKKKTRNFDFTNVLSEIDTLQAAIDEIDAAIQYIDSTKKISI